VNPPKQPSFPEPFHVLVFMTFFGLSMLQMCDDYDDDYDDDYYDAVTQ